MHVPDSDEVLRLYVPEGVFAGYHLYTYRLVQAAMERIHQRSSTARPVQRILVIGTGCGYEAVTLARAFPGVHVSATDVLDCAVFGTMSNAETYRLIGRVNAWKSDLFQRVRAKFDMILFAAPRVIWKADLEKMPGVDSEIEWSRIQEKPDFFDPDGELLKRFLQDLPARLEIEGEALVLTNEDLGRTSLPPLLRDEILSVDPWGRQASHRFAIRRIFPRER
jgi:hypothetical protein